LFFLGASVLSVIENDMGSFIGKTQKKYSSPEDLKKNETVVKQLERSREEDAKIHKILMLGAGESGKTTLFRQMIQIYGKGFTEKDKADFVPNIRANALRYIQILAKDQQPNLSAEQQPNVQLVLDLKEDDVAKSNEDSLDDSLVRAVESLWKDPLIQEAWKTHQTELQLPVSAGGFISDFGKLSSRMYLPTFHEILQTRIKTTGIIETRFEVDKEEFRMFDVGGQKNERRKWMHCFDNVSLIIFVVALDQYDQVMYEDSSRNRMSDALELFRTVATNHKFFLEKDIVLFLNRRDLFQEKIKTKPLTLCPEFKDYRGSSYEDACQYVDKKFLDGNENKDRVIKTHVTCATDTENVKIVFNAVKAGIINKSLKEAGLY